MSLLTIGIASAVGCLFYLGLSWSQQPGLLLDDPPSWLISSARPEAVGVAEAREIARTEANPAAEGLLSLMLPPAALESAVSVAKPKVSFQASVLMPAGLSAEIAECIVAAAQNHYRILDVVRAERSKDPVLARQMEFFFAAWPELADLIKVGAVRLKIMARTDGIYRAAAGTIVHSRDAAKRLFIATIHASKWLIRMEFESGGGAQLLFDEMFSPSSNK